MSQMKRPKTDGLCQVFGKRRRGVSNMLPNLVVFHVALTASGRSVDVDGYTAVTTVRGSSALWNFPKQYADRALRKVREEFGTGWVLMVVSTTGSTPTRVP